MGSEMCIRDRYWATAAQYVTTTPATSKCDPAVSSVANDLKCWNDALQATLATGSAVLVQTAGTATATDPDDDQFDVTIRWQERGAREATGQSDCEAVPARLWADPVCLVTQSWTFRP